MKYPLNLNIPYSTHTGMTPEGDTIRFILVLIFLKTRPILVVNTQNRFERIMKIISQ